MTTKIARNLTALVSVHRFHSTGTTSWFVVLVCLICSMGTLLGAQSDWHPVQVNRDSQGAHFFYVWNSNSQQYEPQILMGYTNIDEFGTDPNENFAGACHLGGILDTKLQGMEDNHVNFLRMWLRPSDRKYAYGKLESDDRVTLTIWNDDFFKRVDDILELADCHHIIVEVMMWDSDSFWNGKPLDFSNTWRTCWDEVPGEDCPNVHHPNNHYVGTNPDQRHGLPGLKDIPNEKISSDLWFDKNNSEWNNVQLAYMRKLMSILQRHNNVTVEIMNETPPEKNSRSVDWRGSMHRQLHAEFPQILLQSESYAPGGTPGTVNDVPSDDQIRALGPGNGVDMVSTHALWTYSDAEAKYHQSPGVVPGCNENGAAEMKTLSGARRIMWGLVMGGGAPYIEDIQPSDGSVVTKEIYDFFHPALDNPRFWRMKPIKDLVAGNDGHKYVLATDNQPGAGSEVLVFVDDQADTGNFHVNGSAPSYQYRWYNAETRAFNDWITDTSWDFKPPGINYGLQIKVPGSEFSFDGGSGGGGGGGGGGGCGAPKPTLRPTAITPERGCYSDMFNPAFSWSSVPDATKYKIKLFEATNQAGDDPLLAYVDVNDTSFTLPFSLTLGKRYRWAVKAKNSCGDGPFSRMQYFTLSSDCHPPRTAPVLIGPKDCVDAVRPVFSWAPVADATEYRIVVSLADHDDFFIDQVVYGTSLVSPEPLIPKIQYRFKVRAINDAGIGPWSDSMYFTPFCGGVASLITAPLGCINTTTPTFTWQAVPPAVQYWLLVGDNPDFSNPSTTWLVNEHLTGTSLSPGVAFNPGQTYYSKVKTILDPSSTLAAAWSPTVSFTPFCPRPPAPAGLVATAGNSRVTLTWAPSAGAIDYNVKRSTASGGPYVPIAGGIATTGYTDLAVSNGTTYYYVVSANTSQGESSSSNEAPATPSPNPPVPVAWVNGVAVAINGSTLTKSDPSAGWFAGAASKQAIAFGDGYVEFTTNETGTYRMAGLSHGDSNQSYTDIDFAIYPAADGNLYIYESGVYKAALGPYAVGDRLRVSVEAGAVRYRRNGALLYTSSVVPAYPLLADSSLYSPGAVIANAVIYGTLTGNQAPVANAGGPYTGVINSSISFSGAASWDPEGAIVSYSWDFGDGSTGSGVTAVHTYATMGRYTVTLTIRDDGGLTSTATTTVSLAQPVQWISAVGVTVNGNSLSKSDPDGGWYAGAASQQVIVSGDAFVEFTVNENNTYRMVGLSNGNTDQTYWDIDFAIYPAADGNLYVYEAGVYKTALGAYAAGDRLRISVESGAVRYRRNGELLYTSAVTPVYPLLVDTSFYSPGATISNAVVAGNLAPPDPAGTPVIWTNPVGVSISISGNSLTKSDPNAGWYAGAASRQTIASGDGYVEFTANETNTYRMVGLSNGDSDQTYWDIDFAIYPAADGNLYVYEAGVYKAALGPYVTGDRLRVSVEAGVVKYRKNGWPLYTSTVAPTYPLLVDTSFYTPGATVNNAVVVGNWGP